MTELGDVSRREVEQELDALAAGSRRKLAELETLQNHYRREAKLLDGPIKRLKDAVRVIERGKGIRAAGNSVTGAVGEETIAKVEAYLKSHAEVMAESGGFTARELSNRMDGVSYDSVRRSLQTLEERGVVHIAGKRTGMRGTAPVLYKLSEVPVV